MTTISNKGCGAPCCGNAGTPTQVIAVDLLATCLLALVWTICGQVLLAFFVMTALAGVIGFDASYRIERGGALVTLIFGGFLMAIN